MAPYLESLGAYSGANLLGNVAAGLALDRWGRRRPTLLGLAVSGLALMGYALVRSPLQLLGVRVVHGLATAALSPGAFALLGDASPGDRRGRVMGVSGALIALAAVVGPPLGGLLRDLWGFGAVFLVGGGLMLAVALAFARWAEETAEGVLRSPSRGVWREAPGLLVRPRLLGAYLAALGLTLGLGTLVAYLPLRMEAFGASGVGAGSAFTAYALVAMAMMLGPGGRWSDRFPAVTALVADASALRERGTAFGLFYAVYSLGAMLGSALAGVVAEQAGIGSGLPFLAAGALGLLAVPLVYRLARGGPP